jgi:hypothetical protein
MNSCSGNKGEDCAQEESLDRQIATQEEEEEEEEEERMLFLGFWEAGMDMAMAIRLQRASTSQSYYTRNTPLSLMWQDAPTASLISPIAFLTSLGPGLHQATKVPFENVAQSNLQECGRVDNVHKFFLLIDSNFLHYCCCCCCCCYCSPILVVNSAAALLASFDVFVCLWIGWLCFRNSASNRQWQVLRVQAPGCLHKTIPKLQVCFS